MSSGMRTQPKASRRQAVLAYPADPLTAVAVAVARSARGRAVSHLRAVPSIGWRR
jgi:hypothetical protein